MKYILQAFIGLLLLQSCQSDELKVSFKTIEISIPGTLGPSLKHHSKYYCYFEKDNPLGSNTLVDFYILDENGKTEAHIPPPPILFSDYTLSVKNDTVFTTHYHNYSSFYLDEKQKKWIRTSKTTDIVFKDKNYTIDSNTSGIGCYETKFIDHKTRQQYEIYLENPMVNKVNNSYYITSTDYILKISDPKKMEIAGQSNSKDHYCSSQNIDSFKGAEIQYKNELPNMFKFSIATSFAVKNQLYHLYSEDGSTKIAVLKNKEFVTIFEFKDDIHPYRKHYDSMSFIPGNEYQTLRFSTKNPHTYGIIEIDKNKFNVITFKNTYREPILGEPYTKAWVEKNFMDFYTHFNTLSINQINRIEQKENALNLTQLGLYNGFPTVSSDDFPTVYQKIERKYIHLITSYYYSHQNKLLKLIEFEWIPQSYSALSNEDDIKVRESLDTQKIFKSKYTWLHAFLKQKLGEPVSETANGPSYMSAKWETGTEVIELSYYSSTTLTLYKKQNN
ncbi:Uncharacterised protein [Chryseobacterium nakagawai]|uniref:Lipoprotein n=1 Tax=Chryseobacterium nakagawai TaxID=1241982 RepID=A0AAD0YR79_CHRNA|nr:hypothetical protein [Chryseobacterium nakagawai]AZA93490.1 hypothetical protein EG343_24210 [Chryseobacterium nakagawai]VEH20177.1 Uncharacterised protein [Chryseobacterium nakagawai]